MKTGLESLDVGAPDITYSGNQGPKSPQEDQQKMQEFQMAQLQEEYEKHVFEMQEQGLEPMSLEQFTDQVMSEGQMSSNQEGIGGMMQDPRTMAADGGIMRTGFRGGGMNMGNQSNQAQSAAMGNSSGNQGNQNFGPAEYGSSTAGTDRYPSNIDTSRYTTDTQDRNQRETIARNIAANEKIAEQKELEKFIKEQEKFVAIKKGIEKTTAAKKAKLADVASIKNIDDEDDSEDVRSEYVSTMYNDIPSLASGKRTTQQQSTIDQLGDFSKAMQKSIKGPGINPFVKTILNKIIPFSGTFAEYLKQKNYDPFGYPTTKTTPPTTTGGDGNNMNSYIPPMTMANVAGTGTDTTGKDTTDIDNEFVANFLQPNRNLSESDLARINRIGDIQGAADGGMARERAAFGGIMGDDGRRAYGLGSIFKKAARAVKKVAKSPIGKAALLAGGAGLLGFGPAQGLRNTSLGNFLMGRVVRGGDMTGGILRKAFLQDPRKAFSMANINPFKTIGLTSLLPFLMPQEEEDENLDSLSGARDMTKMDPRGIRQYIAANKGRVDPNEYAFLQPSFYAADGGRIDYADGGIGKLRGALSNEQFGYDEDDDDDIKKLAFGGSAGMPPVTMMSEGQNIKSFNDDESMNMAQGTQNPMPMPMQRPMMDPRMMQQMMMAQRMNPQMGSRMMAAMGGRMGYAEGGDEGELLDMNGMEKDYRNDGGFVPMGEYERKDDVPARLSKNEFVFTADAVRNAGGGDIDRGAEIMENMMKNLEDGGQVSQESQGLQGAREMFQTQQRLGEVL